jgi:hypothetical protein
MTFESVLTIIFRIGLTTLMLLMSASVEAAEFYMSKMTEDTYQINMTGEITDGDHERLLSVISNSPKMFLASGSLKLSSPGGSVSEAIKIANIVEKASFTTGILDNGYCASSCFLIWVAGPIRDLDSRLLIHRPYISADTYNKNQTAEVTEAHQIAMQQVREYLELKSVPTPIIEKMMSLPSTEAHELTDEERVTLRLMSPSFEEISIAKCNISASQSIELGSHIPQDKVDCVNGLRDISRIKFLIDILGEQPALKALCQLLVSKGLDKNKDGTIRNCN